LTRYDAPSAYGDAMKKRSRAGGEPIKGRRLSTSEPKRRNAPKVQARAKLSPATEETEVARLTRELSEERKQRTATSEVLHLLSGSHGDLNRLFDTILTNATKLCQATFGALFLCEADAFRVVAQHNAPPAYAELRQREPLARGRPLLRMAETKQLVHIADLREYVASNPADKDAAAFAKVSGVRTVLIVPMLKDREVLGAIVIYRQEVRTFNHREIELLKSFAAQAVITIENARLVNELRQRTTQLTEALEQQTATSNVLQVISSSPGNLEPVFLTMLENAVRLCDAKFGSINRWDGEALHLVGTYNVPPAFAEFRKRTPFRPGPENPISRMLMTKTVIHFHNLATEQGYIERNPTFVAAVELGGVRTFLAAPMLKENELIGVVIVYRQEVRPFSEKQIEIIKNFAAQAVIAIENARLLNELRQSLEQQTATAEVLRVISTSPNELDPVFRTMLTNATRLCEADFGQLLLHQGDGQFLAVAMHNAPPAFADLRKREPVVRFSETLARAVTDKQIQFLQISDCTEDAFYKRGGADFVKFVDLCKVRTLLGVKLRKDDELIGVFGIYRKEVRPFTEKQIALLRSFADQAVIAIENARLLNELRQRTTDLTERTADLTEALEQQTATSEVLQVISSSPGDLEPVFASMLEKAVRVCEATFGNIYRWDGEAFYLLATKNTPQALAEYRRSASPVVRPAPDTLFGRLAAARKAIHIPDLAADQLYSEKKTPAAVAAVEVGGVRTILVVPMLKEDELIGCIFLFRRETNPFTEKQIDLVKNFAAQAVIAIENARLLKELRERTEQVEAQSQELVKLNQHLEQRVTDQVDEIERMGRLRRFLPPQVADLIVASGSEKQLESHRREITALFCDLRGFTGFTESADAEDVMALLRDYHAAIGEIIIKYNGTLERYAGDGVMVVFNDPVPVDNPALQAVLMALELREAIGALTATWSRLGHEIGFGIGIAHGFATLGTIGFEGRFDYAAIGTVSNVASRLCDEAKPGQILISARVLTKVENAVQVEPVGEFELKGIRRPLAAYNVVAAQSSEK
jgi:GAF domain-containing protein